MPAPVQVIVPTFVRVLLNARVPEETVMVPIFETVPVAFNVFAPMASVAPVLTVSALLTVIGAAAVFAVNVPLAAGKVKL